MKREVSKKNVKWSPGGGYTYEAAPDNSYPFYYDPFNGELAGQKTTNTLSFSDGPSDPCLKGPLGLPSFAYLTNAGIRALCGNSTAPSGSSLAFTTHLAGVLSNGTAQDLGVGFTWTDSFNGTFGGIATTKNTLPLDSGSGEGGITILSVQQISDFTGVIIGTVNGVPPSVTVVSIAIKPPTASPVPINPGSRGVIPVAILSTNAFNATTVDPTTVRFGTNNAKNSSPASVEDVNGDGRPDLVLHFRSQDTGIACGDSVVTLTGKTTANISFTGSEAIQTVGCK
jgi:hypothetical protein